MVGAWKGHGSWKGHGNVEFWSLDVQNYQIDGGQSDGGGDSGGGNDLDAFTDNSDTGNLKVSN